MAKILVTGGAGFIGSHLVDKLIELGHQVVVLDDFSSGKKENVNSKAKVYVKNIKDSLGEIFEKEQFGYVFHLAADVSVRRSVVHPKKNAEINILGSLNVIENCVKYGVGKIVFSSTGGAIYAPDSQIPSSENDKLGPVSPYGVSKWVVERYLEIFKEVHGLDYTCLRYSNVYGPRQDASGEAGVVAIFFNDLFTGKNLHVFGDGTQTRDFVYVKDVVEANVKAMTLSGIYNVSTGKETSVHSIADKIVAIMNSKAEIEYGPAVKGELKRSCLSYEKLRKEGWMPKYDLDKGLQESVAWFRSQKIVEP